MTRTVLTAACLFLLGTSTAFADDTLWTRRYDGSGDDAARDVLTDASNNVVMVGTGPGLGYDNDFVVVKYSPDGDTFWTRCIAGPPGSNDEAMAAAIDPSGAISITGSTGSWPDFNILTVKLYPDGSESWRATNEGPAHYEDGGRAIAVDDSGNVFVTGYAKGATNTDFVTIKYDVRGGEPVWTAVLNNGGDDHPTAIALGPDGGVYVTGSSVRGGSNDYATVKYSAAGVEEWVAFYNGPGNGPDQAVALAVDPSGNAYVTGVSATAPPPGGTNHYATVKYANDSGTEMWVARYTGEDGNNSPAAIALGESAVYLTGSSQKDTDDYDCATIAYDLGTGDTLWVRRFDGPAGRNDAAVDVAVGPSGNVYVGGSDFTTLRYSVAGVLEGIARYDGPDGRAVAIAVDSRSCPIVVGHSFGSGSYDIVTVKYDSAFGGIVEFAPAVPARPGMRLAPNPARNWTNLQHSLSDAAPTIVSLLGVDGRVVRTQRLDGQAGVPARLDLTGLASGVYVVRLDAAGRNATQRLVVLR